MYAAAFDGNIDVCQLIYSNGGKVDIQFSNVSGETPFACAAGNDRRTFYEDYEAVQWLVLHGALCFDDNPEVDNANQRAAYAVHGKHFKSKNEKNALRFEREVHSSCKWLVKWADDVVRSHSSVIVFLLGTLPPTDTARQQCNLQCFGGHPGIRKRIADFVGLEITKETHLRILRSVKNVLPSYVPAPAGGGLLCYGSPPRVYYRYDHTDDTRT